MRPRKCNSSVRETPPLLGTTYRLVKDNDEMARVCPYLLYHTYFPLLYKQFVLLERAGSSFPQSSAPVAISDAIDIPKTFHDDAVTS